MSAPTILFPSADHDSITTAIPATFVAVGLVGATLDRATLSKVDVNLSFYCNSKSNCKDDTVTARLRPHTRIKTHNQNYLEWIAVLSNRNLDAPTRAKITVSAYYYNDTQIKNSVNLWLKPCPHHLFPTIDWPESDNYPVTGDELSLFLTFGSTKLPLTRIDMTTATVPVGTMGATNCEWDPVDQFWWATFQPGALTGDAYSIRSINVANTDGPALPRTVVVG